MTSEQFIQEGKQHFSKLQFGEAEKSFRAALQADAKSIDGHMELVRVCVLQGKSDEAEKLLSNVLTLAPENAVALAWKGLLSMRAEQWNEAIHNLQKARQSNPTMEISYVNLARCFRKSGNLKAAEEMAREAIKLNSQNVRAHAELAVVLLKTRRPAAAIAEFIEAIRTDPSYIRPYLALGRLYQKAGKIDLTIDLYRAGAKQNPHALVLQEELLSIYATQRDFVRAYKEAVMIALRRQTYSDWLRVGNCAVAIGRNRKAEKAFKKSLEVNSAKWEAHYNLAELYFNAKLYDAAKAEYTRAIQLNPENYKPLNGLGLLTLIADKNPEEAAKQFETALKLAPRQKEPLLNMAIASAARKLNSEAETYARATLQAATPGDGIYEQAERLIAKVEC